MTWSERFERRTRRGCVYHDDAYYDNVHLQAKIAQGGTYPPPIDPGDCEDIAEFARELARQVEATAAGLHDIADRLTAVMNLFDIDED